MRKWIGLGLLVAVGMALTACFSPAPVAVSLLYYPQNPSLCPGGVKMFDTGGNYPPIALKPTTNPPTPPASEEVIQVILEPIQYIWLSMVPGPEHSRFAFTCEAGSGWITTPGPRLPPRDEYVRDKGAKVLVVVEDPSQAGYLRWYWAYYLRPSQ